MVLYEINCNIIYVLKNKVNGGKIMGITNIKDFLKLDRPEEYDFSDEKANEVYCKIDSGIETKILPKGF